VYDLSLIICTRNRANQLAQTLERVLLIQSQLNWELIIADNESTDGTHAVIQEFAKVCNHPVQMIREPGRGVSYARNAAWQAASAEIVTYIDDDCYPAEDFLDAIFDCFSKDQALGFVGGRILLHDPSDRRITIQESMQPLQFAPKAFIRPGVIQGANVAFRRAALVQVGGFDPWFGAGAHFTGEEAELLARISATGWTGAYDPAPLVYHHHRRKTASEEWHLMRSYDWGRGAYYAKCMLNKEMGEIYRRNWLLTRSSFSWKTSALEIVGGLKYIAQALIIGRSLS
jgi:glycosyltransferase involved in cell wall biosynthesis